MRETMNFLIFLSVAFCVYVAGLSIFEERKKKRLKALEKQEEKRRKDFLYDKFLFLLKKET